jgi:nitroreductase
MNSLPDSVQFFIKLVESRRSIRLFDSTPVPDFVIRKSFDLALLAPNSSNLQPWEFYWVKSPEKKTALISYCLSQAAAATAQELVVCVARTNTWKRNCEFMRTELSAYEKNGTRIPKAATFYYTKLVPLVYNQGPLGLFGFFKKVAAFFVGMRRPISREPFSKSQMQIWATKSTALACENFMLAVRAFGFDTCPMEGIDSYRIRKLLALPSDALIPMVIAIGHRRPEGVTLPRIRADQSLFIKEV